MTSRLDDRAIAQDAVLVESHLAGDPSAFAALYARHYPRVLRTLRGRVHDRTEAEDLAQETFAHALAGLDQLRRPERFYAWLAAIARHMVARHHRLSARLWVIADVDTGRLTDAPDSELMRRVDADNVNTALSRVRARHREILSMREDEGLSYEEIAARLGTPVSTVAPLLFRARQALRREYLAITEPHLVLWPFGMFAAIRRARMRLAYGTSGLQNAAASSAATAAIVAAGVGALLLPLGPTSGSEGHAQPAGVAAPSSAHADPASAVTPSGRGDGDPSRHRHAPTAEAQRAALPAVAGYQPDVVWEDEAMRRRRDDVRHMPYSAEVGPTWIGIDPDQIRHDLQSTLSGDYSWMED